MQRVVSTSTPTKLDEGGVFSSWAGEDPAAMGAVAAAVVAVIPHFNNSRRFKD
jgi:hypothetical protein